MSILTIEIRDRAAWSRDQHFLPSQRFGEELGDLRFADLLSQVLGGCIPRNLVMLDTLSRSDQREIGRSIVLSFAFGDNLLAFLDQTGHSLAWLPTAPGTANIAGVAFSRSLTRSSPGDHWRLGRSRAVLMADAMLAPNKNPYSSIAPDCPRRFQAGMAAPNAQGSPRMPLPGLGAPG